MKQPLSKHCYVRYWSHHLRGKWLGFELCTQVVDSHNTHGKAPSSHCLLPTPRFYSFNSPTFLTFCKRHSQIVVAFSSSRLLTLEQARTGPPGSQWNLRWAPSPGPYFSTAGASSGRSNSQKRWQCNYSWRPPNYKMLGKEAYTDGVMPQNHHAVCVLT